MKDQRTKMPLGFRSVRDILTAALGAAGIVYETLAKQGERPTLLIVFAGLLGLPLVLREQGGQAGPPDDPGKESDKPGTGGGDSGRDGPG